MKKRKGVTLVELILTLAIATLVLSVAFSVFSAGTTSHSISTSKGFAQQDIRIVADFLTSELRFVTDISEIDYGHSEYYSLRIDNEGNLVKTKHVYLDDDSVDQKIIRSIPGNAESINIINNNSGVINVILNQIEKTGGKESGYKLEVSITTENALNMIRNLSIDLVKGDILYYKNTKISSLANSIYLQKPDMDQGSETVTVHFYINDGEEKPFKSITGKTGMLENLPQKPERYGYIFSYWSEKSDGSGIRYGSGEETTFYMPSNDTDLYAHWDKTDGGLAKVTIEKIESIDEVKPDNPDSENRYVVNRKGGSKVKIKLLGYTSDHKDKVSVSIKDTTVAIENNGYITFTAAHNSSGKNQKFEIEIKIKTDGYDEFKKTFKFINSN